MTHSVLSGLRWRFRLPTFDDEADFERAVLEYQGLFEEAPHWESNADARVPATIRVQYMYWEGDEQLEPVVTLTAKNGRAFTEVELFMQLHNAAAAHLTGMDKAYMEGLVQVRAATPDAPAFYRLRLGS